MKFTVNGRDIFRRSREYQLHLQLQQKARKAREQMMAQELDMDWGVEQRREYEEIMARLVPLMHD